MAADYWALGVLTFEMLTGQSPFRRSAESSELEVLEAITAHRLGGLETAGAWGAGARAAVGGVDGATGAAPRRATAAARGLVERLLDPDEDSRLRFISPAHATASAGDSTSGAGAPTSFRNHAWFQQVASADWTDDAVMQRIATEANGPTAPSGAAGVSHANKKNRSQTTPTCAVENAKQLAQQKDDTISAAGGVGAVLEWYKSLLVKRGDALPSESESEMALRRYWQRMDAGVAISPHEAMAEARLNEICAAADSATSTGTQMYDHTALHSAVATSVAFVDF